MLKPLIEAAIRRGDGDAVAKLGRRVLATYGGKPPVVLDMFSGRAIIPLEAARASANAIGIDLSPVATLAGRLLAIYPALDWSEEPALPFAQSKTADAPHLSLGRPDRLARDVEAVLAEIGRRVSKRIEAYYPRNQRGEYPWGYLWAITMPCDACKHRFPLIGSLVLRYPYKRAGDPGQSLRLTTTDGSWGAEVVDGPPVQAPTYSSGLRADGKKKKGKSARCLFCGHIHGLETVKAKGDAQQYVDALIAVADTDETGKRYFRAATAAEVLATQAVDLSDNYNLPYPAVPNELIPAGNVHTVMASGYGYRTFGELMCDRQTLSFVVTADQIRRVVHELRSHGVSSQYAKVLGAYAASVLCKRLRLSTRGVRVRQHGSADGSHRSYEQASDLFSNEAVVYFQFDFFEAGPGAGAGTWSSVSKSAVRAIAKVIKERPTSPARIRKASATALPLRDASVDLVLTDPPYYDMVEYADASDLFHVWLKRVLFDIEPDLFGPSAREQDGLQNKNEEIIVRRVHEPNRVKHDTEFYESMLARSFGEARRVLKPDGHLVVVFGHSDPDAWRRLLGALQTAGFIVTSAWPSRTESGDAGVASIKVTVTIGCRVSAGRRPLGLATQVDREVIDAVMERVRQWGSDGLALEDQLMASYGPAMEVYGRYGRVINVAGSDADLDHYLTIARRAVRDAMRLRIDELPLETFDTVTRFALFWLRAKGRAEVPKGEARFFAQADELRLADLRDRILAESKAGFRLRLDDPISVAPGSSVFEIVRAMAHAWGERGTEGVAEVIGSAGREANDHQLWAVVADLVNHLPASDTTAKALAGMKRTSSTISTLVGNVREAGAQQDLFDDMEV